MNLNIEFTLNGKTFLFTNFKAIKNQKLISSHHGVFKNDLILQIINISATTEIKYISK